MSSITGELNPQTIPVRPRRVWFYDPRVNGSVNTNFPLDLPKKPANIAAVIEKKLEEITKKPMKQLHLVTAVLVQIASFHASKTAFSAYDITSKLREKVNIGDISVVDVPVLGNGFPKIVHEDIRGIVQEVFAEGLIPDYDNGRPYFNSQAQTSYQLYSHQGMAAPVQPAPVSNPFPVSPVSLAPAAPIGTSLNVPDKDMWAKVETYIKNQRSLAGRPTLKRIQSRLKGYAVTCSELESFLVKHNYRLLRPSMNVSEAEVL